MVWEHVSGTSDPHLTDGKDFPAEWSSSVRAEDV